MRELSRISTDGGPAIVGSNLSTVAKIKSEVSDLP